MSEKKYDLVIVGGGPAGLTAAIYASRRELKTLVIAKAIGGQAIMAERLENFPGQEPISGWDLMQKLEKQARGFGAEFISDEISNLSKTVDGFELKSRMESYQASAVVLAFGLTPRDLGVPGEEKLTGHGVAYCATCDGPLYKGKTVAVVGGGNSALDAVLYLSKIAKQVYLVNRTSTFSGAEAALFEQVKAQKNVECFCSHNVKEIKGEDKVTGVVLVDDKNVESEVKVDGIFVEIGYMPKSGWLKGFVNQNERGEIITDKSCQTSVEGVFAAGDCSDVGYKQMVISCGEGAKAALSAYKFVAAKSGKVVAPDWGKRK
jgi:thioredoxin reductase (NADPH)